MSWEASYSTRFEARLLGALPLLLRIAQLFIVPIRTLTTSAGHTSPRIILRALLQPALQAITASLSFSSIGI